MGMTPGGGVAMIVIMVRVLVVMIATRIVARLRGMSVTVIVMIAMFVSMILVVTMMMPVVVIMSVILIITRRTGRRHRGPDRSDRAAELAQGNKEPAAL
jgi:uncharacterized membrane protein